MAVKCWAECMGGCSSIQSREHYITKGLFSGKAVKLKGLPWCKFEEKTVGLAAASSKMLCKTHNEQLSNLDDSAIQAFESFRQIFALHDRQYALPPQSYLLRTWKIDGRLLERWFLKTLVNLVQVQSQVMRWPNGTTDRSPPLDVVEAAYGIVPIVSPLGLHAAAGIGQQVTSGEHIHFAPITDTNTGYIAGGTFEFSGLRFVFAWTQRNLEPFIRHLGEVATPFAGWKESNLLHPFRGMNMEVRGRRTQRLKVTWPPFKPQKLRA